MAASPLLQTLLSLPKRLSQKAVSAGETLLPIIHQAFLKYPLLVLCLAAFLILACLPITVFLFFVTISFFVGLFILGVVECTLMFWAGVFLFWSLTFATFLGIFIGFGLWLAYRIINWGWPALLVPLGAALRRKKKVEEGQVKEEQIAENGCDEPGKEKEEQGQKDKELLLNQKGVLAD